MSEQNPRLECPFKGRYSTVPPRFLQGPITTALNLGPLASLAGSWKGTGFNSIWRPDNHFAEAGPTFIKRFLQLNRTSENITFSIIPAVVPNRGLDPQPDISLYGLHYLQQISDNPIPFPGEPPDQAYGPTEALHIEPGLIMHVPASNSTVPPVTGQPVPPANPDTIVRMASIPHGVTVMMQGKNPGTTAIPGPPKIPPVYPIAGLPKVAPVAGSLGLGILPIDVKPDPGQPAPPAGDSTVHLAAVEQNIAKDNPPNPPGQSNGPFPPIFQQWVNDPNSMLRDAIAHQDILGHITIELSTIGLKSDIGNIPFLGVVDPSQSSSFPVAQANPANAFVSQAAITMWLEWVRIPGFPVLEKLKAIPEGVQSAITAIEPFPNHATHLQLQYSQVVILVFNGVLWPHVTVSTLTLSNG